MNEPNYQQQLQKVMDHVVDRREFLQHIGLALIGLFGVTSVLRSLHSSTLRSGGNRIGRTQSQPHGFGYGPYGR